MRIATILLLLPLLAIPATAAVIDDFQAGETTLGREGLVPPSTVDATRLDPTLEHIVGGICEVTLEKSAGTVDQPYVAIFLGSEGEMGVATYNSTVDCEATWTLVYGADGPMDADLTDHDADAILIDLVSGDMATGPRPVPMTIAVTGGGATASATVDLIEAGLYTLAFSEFPGVDFSHVDRIEITMTQDPATCDAVDFALGSIITGSLQAVVGSHDESWGGVKSLFR